ncbi:unnamed protein product [Caenorhabditis brenneri]
MSGNCVVTLNVGGTIFLTKRSTLTRFNGYLKNWFENNATDSWDPNGIPFVDRDPTHFRYILNFMRDGVDTFLPNDDEKTQEIKNEAKYYRLVELVKLLE